MPLVGGPVPTPECVSAGAESGSVVAQACDVTSEADVRKLKEVAFG